MNGKFTMAVCLITIFMILGCTSQQATFNQDTRVYSNPKWGYTVKLPAGYLRYDAEIKSDFLRNFVSQLKQQQEFGEDSVEVFYNRGEKTLVTFQARTLKESIPKGIPERQMTFLMSLGLKQILKREFEKEFPVEDVSIFTNPEKAIHGFFVVSGQVGTYWIEQNYLFASKFLRGVELKSGKYQLYFILITRSESAERSLKKLEKLLRGVSIESFTTQPQNSSLLSKDEEKLPFPSNIREG